MEVRICWMYHDIMDLYGDKGNMMVLKKRCEARGISCTIDTLEIGEEKDLTQYDLLFLGGGADKEQMMLIDDLLSRKENIKQALKQGTFALLICGGYQLFGQYYISADNCLITIQKQEIMVLAALETSQSNAILMEEKSLLLDLKIMVDRHAMCHLL